MRKSLKAALRTVALASLFSTPALAVATGPTDYAIMMCWPDQWQEHYDSYTACARDKWAEYCRWDSPNTNDSLQIHQQCAAGNPFG